MKARLFSIESYLGEDEWFHFARKRIGPEPPRFAHFHNYHELFLVQKGPLEHWVNGSTVMLEPGSLVFMRPGDRHALRAVAADGSQIINIMFRSSSADHLVSRYRDDLDGLFFWAEGKLPEAYRMTGPRLERAINVAQELQTSIRSLSRIEEFLLTVMTRVVDLPEAGGGAMPFWLAQACTMARRPEVFRGGAAAFVLAAGRGHEHVCRVARQHLGVSPSSYVNRIRMEHAAMLLASDDTPIPEVALSCGIENQSHFYRVFRRHYGVTPLSYRRQHQKSPV